MKEQPFSGIPYGHIVLGAAAWLTFVGMYTTLLPQIVAAGGYVLANLLLGAGMIAASILLISIVRRVYKRTELAEDPEPLMQSWEYELPARTTLATMWIFGVLFWALGIGLWFLAEYSYLVAGPIIGTLLILLGYMGLDHAKLLSSRIRNG